MDDDKIEVLYKDKTKDSFSALVTKDKVETIYKKDNVQIAKTTIDDSNIKTAYKAISSVTMDDSRVEVKYKEKSDILMRDDYLKIRTLISSLELNGGKVLQTSNDADIKSVAPIGLNDGLYITGLGPYLTAETVAVTALQSAAAAAAAQLAMLDAQSGAVGTITGLGTAINAFCAAMMTADSTAHTAIAKAVK
jgi:hypothetical protein